MPYAPKPRVMNLPRIIDEEMEACLAQSPTLATLNTRQQKFAVAVAFQPIPHFAHAAEVAGYSASSPEVLEQTGHALAHHPRVTAALVEMARARMGAFATTAGKQLMDLALHADPKIRLRASAEILNRVGLTGIQEVHVKQEHEHHHMITREPTEQEMNAFRERCERLHIEVVASAGLPVLAAPHQEIITDASFVEVQPQAAAPPTAQQEPAANWDEE